MTCKIISVLRSGGDYTPEYVHRLRDGVAANMQGAYKFVCLSDVQIEGVNTIPLETDWPGWWAKLEMFKLGGPCLYFDLDTIIKGDITPLAELCAQHNMIMLRDFNYRGKGVEGASGVMGWSKDMSYLMHRYDPAKKYPGLGDQGYIATQCHPVYWQDIAPGLIVSRKLHRDRRNAAVVCYHGKPRPKDTGWAA